MSALADQLRFGEVYEIKLGKSFRRGKSTLNNSSRSLNNSNANGDSFHTIRYDFKPASVDPNKVATIEFEDSNKATVVAPNVEGSGFPHTVFKGPCKPHAKECVLIINQETGEITLERLSQNIVVKKTRAEGTSKVHQPQRPITPSLEVSATGNAGPIAKKCSPSITSGSGVCSNSSATQQQQKSISPKRNDAFKMMNMKSNQMGAFSSPSLNSNSSNGFNPTRPLMPIASDNHSKRTDEEIVARLSESSSESANESSDSDSSSESESDSDDDDESEPEKNSEKVFPKPRNAYDMPMFTAGQFSSGDQSSTKPTQVDDDSSNESDLDSVVDNDVRDRPTTNLTTNYNARDTKPSSAFQSMPNIFADAAPLSTSSSQVPLRQPTTNRINNNGNLNMPTGLRQLTQDLQLSESGSDSE